MAIRDRIVGLRRVRAGDLLPDTRNWRRHPKIQRDALAGVLKEIGYADALLVRETAEGLRLIDGHLRVELTPDQEVPVLVLDVDEAEAGKLLLTLDPLAAMAQPDTDAILALLRDTTFESQAVNAMLEALANGETQPLQPSMGLTEPDEVSPPMAEPYVERGDVWQLEQHRVMCGDSCNGQDMELLMGGKKASLVWTDPPYGVDIGRKNRYLQSRQPARRIVEPLMGDTPASPEESRLFLRAAFESMASRSDPGSAWYVAAPPGPLQLVFGDELNRLGIWRQTILWVKQNATFATLGVDYHWRAEPMFYGWLPGAAHRWYGGRKQDTVWEFDRPLASLSHPTMKPVALIERAVQNSSEFAGCES